MFKPALQIAALVALCAPLAPANARATAARASATRYIVQSEGLWAESVTTSDASVVQRILADDVVWVFDGAVLDKQQAVREARAGPGDFLSNHVDYVHVRFFGSTTAIAQGSETWTKSKGAMTKGRFVWTDTWVKRHGRWQIVNTQDTTVPVQ